jgi:lysophospholipase L1-like esterase
MASDWTPGSQAFPLRGVVQRRKLISWTSLDSATLRSWIAKALAIAQVIVVLIAVRQWAYVTTYRLYLEAGTTSPTSAAAQRFDVEGHRVVPRIVTRGPDRVSYAADVSAASTIQVGLRPTRPTRYAIEWRDSSSHRVLAQGSADQARSIACASPRGRGTIELVSDQAVAWVDPRIVQDGETGWYGLALAMLLLSSIAWARWRQVPRDSEAGDSTRIFWFKVLAVSVGTAVPLLASETALRLMGDAAPSGILEQRHDLGEVTRDARWEYTPRYGRRLRPNVNKLNEWRYGDIVRLGFVPAAVSDGTMHRFRFQTDAEGFRNPVTRDRFEIAALGDSFTDAMTMAVDASWPMQLEQRLGVAVQNYGTAAFGPQQELRVLKDFVAPHKPHVVVLAFFAGNDIFDAEAFDAFERSGGAQAQTEPGWRIKDTISRADTWYLVSAVRAAAAWWSGQEHTGRSAAERLPVSISEHGTGEPASFDRGMFAVTVGNHRLRWALMPPYLNTLNFSEQELAGRRGWSLTRGVIADMQNVSRSFGAEFVVMFIPFKSQVYLPILERAFSREDLHSAFRFYLDGSRRPVDLDAMHRNRLAQNDMMRQLCNDARIPFLDTTAALERVVTSGENVYFPDESHLNERGEAVLADALSAFLRAHQIS